MKRNLLILTTIICMLFGCSNDFNKDLPLGTYTLEKETELPKPYVKLEEDNKFVFSYSLLSSYLPMGTYEISDSQLILLDDDNKYVFDINGDTIVFNAKSSSKVTFGDVSDGSVFEKDN